MFFNKLKFSFQAYQPYTSTFKIDQFASIDINNLWSYTVVTIGKG